MKVNKVMDRSEPRTSYIKSESLPRPGDYNTPQSHEAFRRIRRFSLATAQFLQLPPVYDNLQVLLYIYMIIKILKLLPKLPQ